MNDLQIPAHLMNRTSRGLAAQLALSLPSGGTAYLSIKGSRFTLFDAAGNERQVGSMDNAIGMYLDVCIIDSNPKVSKIYYARDYDPNAEAMVPPDCWSDNGQAPSSQAISPQHGDCKTCPHNQWGSATSRLTGKPTKACNDVQKVAIVVPGQGEMVFLLRIPPASLKNLGKYIQEINSISIPGLGRKLDINDVYTRVYFDKDAVGILKFSVAPPGLIDAETAALSDRIYESKATAQIVGKNDVPFQGAITAIAPPAAQGLTPERSLPPPPAFNPPHPRNELPATGGLSALTSLQAPAAEAPPPPKPRGRPRKEPVVEAPATQAPFMASAPTPTSGNGTSPPTTPDDNLDIPPFLKRLEAAPGMPPATPPKPAGPSFGMQQATAAPDDMNARIQAALGLKT